MRILHLEVLLHVYKMLFNFKDMKPPYIITHTNHNCNAYYFHKKSNTAKFSNKHGSYMDKGLDIFGVRVFSFIHTQIMDMMVFISLTLKC